MRIFLFFVFSQIFFSFLTSSCKKIKPNAPSESDLKVTEKSEEDDLGLSDTEVNESETKGGGEADSADKSEDTEPEQVVEVIEIIDPNSDGVDTSDVNAEASSLTTYYKDSDGDGFGDLNQSLDLNVQAKGYVTDNTDCDDTEVLINPNSIWYDDKDSDGFGDNAGEAKFTYQCEDPSTSDASYAANNLDCDDTTESVKDSNELWYEDKDADGFGDPESSMTSCFPPTGYVLNSEDNCPSYPDSDNLDSDEDGVCDSIDNCPIGGSPRILITGFTGDLNDSDYQIHDASLYTVREDLTAKISDSTTFPKVFASCSASSDFDQDGDIDLVIIGNTDCDQTGDTGGDASCENWEIQVGKIYTNTGEDSFVENTLMGLPELAKCDVKAADFNQDGFDDLVIIGYNGSSKVTNLYLNDGNSFYPSFTHDPNSGLDDIGINYGSIATGDLDGDSDLDLVISGISNISSSRILVSYLNDGDATFTLGQSSENDTNLIQVNYSITLIEDFDGDLDLDLFVSGNIGNSEFQADLYLNDGLGNFVLKESNLDSSDTNVFKGSHSWQQQGTSFDVEGDGDMDIILTGWCVDGLANCTGGRVADLYLNDGNGMFIDGTSSDPNYEVSEVNRSEVAAFDLNNDGLKDFVLIGDKSGTGEVAEIYRNNGDTTFTKTDSSANTSTHLVGLEHGSIEIFCDE